jgi:hypothetical protein
MGPIGSLETSVRSYNSKLRTIPKERRLSLVGREEFNQGLHRSKYLAFVQMFIPTGLRRSIVLDFPTEVLYAGQLTIC